MMGKASGLPDVAIVPMASSVSENSSLANLPTASSNGPANAGSAKAAIRKTERASVRRRSKTLASTLRPRQKWKEGGDIAAFHVSWLLFENDPFVGSCSRDQEDLTLEDQEDLTSAIRNPDRRTCWSWCCSCRTSCRPSRRSGPWSLQAPSTMHRRPPGPGSSTPRRTGRWL